MQTNEEMQERDGHDLYAKFQPPQGPAEGSSGELSAAIDPPMSHDEQFQEFIGGMVTALDELRDKMAKVLEENAGIETPGFVRLRSDADRLAQLVEAARPDAIDLRIFSQRQPTAKELSYPMRVVILRDSVRHRMAKSKFQFVDPLLLRGALESLVPGVAPEVEHRLLHFADSITIRRDAPVIALIFQRLVKAGNLAGLDEPPQIVVNARRAIANFLEDVR
jgi:hypothetical protein